MQAVSVWKVITLTHYQNVVFDNEMFNHFPQIWLFGEILLKLW